MEAKREWRGVSGLSRKTSRTFEHCFAALASLIVMLALCALYDLRQGPCADQLNVFFASWESDLTSGNKKEIIYNVEQ